MKIKLTIAYDGTNYNGSQIQPSLPTIQSQLMEAFQRINIQTSFDFSGRTDKGVHAFRQIVSCNIPEYWNDLKRLTNVLNKQLPHTIQIRNIQKVDKNFHARFSATKREYRYLITEKKLSVFNSNYMSHYNNIDEEKIKEAISYFIGIHDFEFFSKKGSDPVSTVREIYNIRFYKYKDIYVLNFQANSYLRSQIRMIVDFIMKISSGKLTIKQLQEQLNKKKLISWTLAPANGLYLSKILYKETL
ncbi:tRNA pseudouridine(38-40) synthase TruA [Arcobacter sp. 15-2]|uniref:tRNA pseudouridine(38-40) synthase TruA n=1 Tax=Arcobacter sp. 15-2 TaxID=3374109 RepID=UPI00399D4E3F